MQDILLNSINETQWLKPGDWGYLLNSASQKKK